MAEKKNDYNILILGETGVGKSTWINGIVNYIKYSSLRKAMSDELLTTFVPFKFGYTNEYGETEEISFGQDSNEVVDVGKSATQHPREYVIETEDAYYHLIDTPGIGDTRGIEKDKENFENILAFLTCYDRLNAVVVLVKPNAARLTIAFKFCILELLTHLHKSLAESILFAFTNSRATFYRPGDSFLILKKLLKEYHVNIQLNPSTYFCFDNESFRFLACVKKGVPFSLEETELYAKSWDQASKTTWRLFEAVKTLKIHYTKNTVSLNEARNCIIALSKPMGEAIKLISMNLDKVNKAKDKNKICYNDIQSFKQQLKFKGFSCEKIHLDQPVTVCTNKSCVEYIPIGQSGVTDTIYSQKCHNPCYLSDVRIQVTNNEKLFSCAAMDKGTCTECNHTYNEHMHITYTEIINEEEFLSEKTQQKIAEKKTEKERVEALEKVLEQKNKQLNDEKEEIYRSAVTFGAFLNKNALISYNDSFGEYMDMLIKDESSKEDIIRDEKKIEQLKKDRIAYEQKKKILQETLASDCDEDEISPEKIFQIKENLTKLKYNGNTLNEALGGILEAKQNRQKRVRKPTTFTRSDQKKKSGSWFK